MIYLPVEIYPVLFDKINYKNSPSLTVSLWPNF